MSVERDLEKEEKGERESEWRSAVQAASLIQDLPLLDPERHFQ